MGDCREQLDAAIIQCAATTVFLWMVKPADMVPGARIGVEVARCDGQTDVVSNCCCEDVVFWYFARHDKLAAVLRRKPISMISLLFLAILTDSFRYQKWKQFPAPN